MSRVHRVADILEQLARDQRLRIERHIADRAARAVEVRGEGQAIHAAGRSRQDRGGAAHAQADAQRPEGRAHALRLVVRDPSDNRRRTASSVSLLPAMRRRPARSWSLPEWQPARRLQRLGAPWQRIGSARCPGRKMLLRHCRTPLQGRLVSIRCRRACRPGGRLQHDAPPTVFRLEQAEQPS
jgi:hypothetical protein